MQNSSYRQSVFFGSLKSTWFAAANLNQSKWKLYKTGTKVAAWIIMSTEKQYETRVFNSKMVFCVVQCIPVSCTPGQTTWQRLVQIWLVRMPRILTNSMENQSMCNAPMCNCDGKNKCHQMQNDAWIRCSWPRTVALNIEFRMSLLRFLHFAHI